jgi:hypothetical protein
MTAKGWTSVLEAAAAACAGEDDGCCEVREPGEPCCMTEKARLVFKMIEAAGGPSLEQIEAIARGELFIASLTALTLAQTQREHEK